MKVKQVTVRKEFKFGLPQYSNITAGCEMTVEIGEDEKVDWNELWDEVNRQLYLQSDIDPAWQKTDEFREHFRLTMKIPKGGDK